jgi:hypothetical protein
LYHQASSLLNVVWNIVLRTHEHFARYANHTFIEATSGRWEHVGFRFFGDVDPDYSEIACFEFENVRATGQGCRALSVCVRVLSNASYKHD